MSPGRTAATGNTTSPPSAINSSTPATTAPGTNIRRTPATAAANLQSTPAPTSIGNTRSTPPSASAVQRSGPATNRNLSGSASGTALTSGTTAQIYPQPVVASIPVLSTTFTNLDTTTELILISDRGTYDQLMNAIGRKHLLIEFYAPWCGACMLINKKLEELAVTYTGKLIIAKVNIDDCEQIAVENNVSMMPAFILFKENQILEKFAGSNEEKLMSTIKKHVGEPPNDVTIDEPSQQGAPTSTTPMPQAPTTTAT
ncbi:thioredoxin, mitochondrial [Ceratitis capitata]|uniref:Thioredoxin-T n=1 Tax=Ceratitis capitata TaxID=7213 RepID=W8BPA1_CERCA|nr:thioredoxin, mitochondrial [Ceratitis capitata]